MARKRKKMRKSYQSRFVLISDPSEVMLASGTAESYDNVVNDEFYGWWL